MCDRTEKERGHKEKCACVISLTTCVYCFVHYIKGKPNVNVKHEGVVCLWEYE